VAISDKDRRLIGELHDAVTSTRDVLLSLGRRLDHNTDAMADHRRAIEDNTAKLKG